MRSSKKVRLKKLLTPYLFTFVFKPLNEDQKQSIITVFIKINSMGISTILGPNKQKE